MKAIILLLGILVCPAWAAGGEPSVPSSSSGFTSAKVCGGCHVAIYEGWKESMHAHAVDDPIFYPIFLETSRQTGGKSDLLCLSCHAPTTRVTKNRNPDDPLTAEGVTCDFCHSLQGIDLKSPQPFRLQLGQTQRGPLKEVTSPAHATAFEPIFEQSELCGGCHEYVNERGVPILETYSEWAQGPYSKEGKSCQTCHMPPIEGLTVPPRIKPVKEVYINSHEAAGGHSIEQVKKAVTLRLQPPVRSEDKVHVAVDLTNVGSGHRVPTGLPTRKLVLRLKATSGGIPIYSGERIFQKVVLNESGEVISKDSDLFLKATKVRSDNRLEPKKVRSEHFDFIAPAARPLEIEAEIFYLYQPRLIQETEMKVELGKEKIKLP